MFPDTKSKYRVPSVCFALVPTSRMITERHPRPFSPPPPTCRLPTVPPSGAPMTDTMKSVTPDLGTAALAPDEGAHPGGALIKPGYSPRLTNEDLAPLKKQTWKSYNFFAFWMSRRAQRRRVRHRGQSVRARAGRLAGADRAAGRHHHRLLPLQPGGPAQPGHRDARTRSRRGSRSACSGANIPAIIRGLIAVAWYGIQTYLASHALVSVGGQALAGPGARTPT